METVNANNLVSLSRIPPLFTIMTVGYIYERIGPVRTLFALMLLAGISVIFLGIARGEAVPVAVLLQPAFTAMFFPAGLTAVASIGPASSRNLIFSTMFIFISIVAMGLVPLFIGYMGDYYSFTAGFLLFGIATLLVTPLVLKLKV
jgi:NNP family nitrate/nitrite transporter-like MFS transporter